MKVGSGWTHQTTTMYDVHMAKRFLVAEARARFGEILDEADQGETVIIERRGVQYVLERDEREPARGSRRSVFTWVDPAVMSGQWTWTWTKKGLRFTPRKPRRGQAR
jgi:hypothetical protein